MKEIPAKPSQLQEISRNPLTSSKETLPSGTRELFGKILSEQIGSLSGEADLTPTSQGLPELEGAYKAQTINLPDQANPQGNPITEKINASIDLLDTYASMLSNPENTLKQAHRLLEDLSETNHLLQKELDQSPTTDPQLEKILTHLTTLVKVEQIKIDRGDYTDLS
jgi:hypothetical protein